jgi:hypothetical protein
MIYPTAPAKTGCEAVDQGLSEHPVRRNLLAGVGANICGASRKPIFRLYLGRRRDVNHSLPLMLLTRSPGYELRDADG